jgi:hypothetical protein
MTDIRVTDGDALVVTGSKAPIRTTSGFVLSAINFPSDEVRSTQHLVVSTVIRTTTLRTEQAVVLAAVRGKVENRRNRAWAFSLDGHDFYVLRLGESMTLVYDVTTGQWSRWHGLDQGFWRAHIGGNWLGIQRASYKKNTTQVVCGDDAFGQLYTLDPEQPYDDHPTTTDEKRHFPRKVMGGLPMTVRQTMPVGAVYLTMSFGNPSVTAADVRLRTSDDFGNTWVDHGTVTVTPGDYSQEIVWRSLGLLKAPGKLFEITDTGGTIRIDGLDMR